MCQHYDMTMKIRFDFHKFEKSKDFCESENNESSSESFDEISEEEYDEISEEEYDFRLGFYKSNRELCIFDNYYKISKELASFLEVDNSSIFKKFDIHNAICVYSFIRPNEKREHLLRWKYLNTKCLLYRKSIRDPGEYDSFDRYYSGDVVKIKSMLELDTKLCKLFGVNKSHIKIHQIPELIKPHITPISSSEIKLELEKSATKIQHAWRCYKMR